jgi:ankyrin repeat protein
MCAAKKGHIAIVQALLAVNADHGLKTQDGDTALRFAIASGREEIVELLRAYGAVNERNA